MRGRGRAVGFLVVLIVIPAAAVWITGDTTAGIIAVVAVLGGLWLGYEMGFDAGLDLGRRNPTRVGKRDR